MKIYKKSMLIEESDNVAVAVEPIQAGLVSPVNLYILVITGITI